ncbi:MAG: hypothetical protein D6775_04565, partial [Caldilineae bacterium]
VAANDGDVVSVRLRVSDGFGQGSAWSAWQPFLVDGAPPEITLDMSATTVFSGALLSNAALTLIGDVSDNGGVKGVDVCVDGDCRPATLQLVDSAAPAVYEDAPATPPAIAAGATCGGSEIVRTFSVTESFAIGTVGLGFVAEHPYRDDIQVDLRSPAGTVVRVLADDGLSGTAYENVDVFLSDAAGSGMGGDSDPAAPYYERETRPAQPLRAFQGENSAGVWTLRICDQRPSTHDGRYLRSLLTLIPRDRAAKSGRWQYLTPGGETLDYVTRTVSLFSQDVLGNRTSDPLRLDVTIDNVAPVITTTETVATMLLGDTDTVLRGVVSDGGPNVALEVHVIAPDGTASSQAAALNGDNWLFDLDGDMAGEYTLWMVATDLAGNSSKVGPYTVDVSCTAANLTVAFIGSEPAGHGSAALRLTAVVTNAGEATLPAGLAVGFYARGERIGAATTTQSLASGQSETVSLLWTPEFAGNPDITINPNDPDAGFTALILCETPASSALILSVDDVALYPGWNLVSAAVAPYNADMTVVQEPIAGQYFTIQTFDQGAYSYYPDLPPNINTLQHFDPELGYWIKITSVNAAQAGQGVEATATLRLSGQSLSSDHPLPLTAGWNLVSYPPQITLPVTVALQSIAGQYTAVLGFDLGAQSYYPDLDPSFNTLREMTPGRGYWIRTTAAVTLTYPSSKLLSVNNGQPSRSSESLSAGSVSLLSANDRILFTDPTNTWVDLYSVDSVYNGQPLPVGAVVAAYDPQGVKCGEFVVHTVGQFGIMPCYGDDPGTPEDEGALVGDLLSFTIDGQAAQATAISLNGTPVAPNTPIVWNQHGDRWQIRLNSLPVSTATPTPTPTLTPTPTPTPTSTPTPTPTLTPTPTPTPTSTPTPT